MIITRYVYEEHKREYQGHIDRLNGKIAEGETDAQKAPFQRFLAFWQDKLAELEAARIVDTYDEWVAAMQQEEGR